LNERVTVLYIESPGRSGSTVLAQMLGQIPGFINVGELWLLWERGLRENELCGCGQPFRSCEFWSAVGDEAYGGWDNVDVDAMLAVVPFMRRFRYVPSFALAAGTGMPGRKVARVLEEWVPALQRLYPAIQKVSGARVIVDSSKRFSYALLLSELSSVDLRLAHLVRDSRAVAYSWTRHKKRPEGAGHRTHMPRLGPAWSSFTWNLWHYICEFLPLSPDSFRLRYEDLVRDPASCIDGILAALELDEGAGDYPFLNGQEMALAVDHTVSGNPVRFRSGSIKLRLDREWQTDMRGADRRLVTAMTAPLLLKYGYLGRGREAK
jgi:hypothetical protein